MLPRSQHSVAVLSHAHHRGDKRYNTLYRAFCQYLFSKKFRIFSAPPSRFAHGVKAGARESGSFPACGMFRFYSAYGRNRRLRALDYSTLIRASAAVMRFCCRVWRSFTPAMRFCCRVWRSFTPVLFLHEEKETACDMLHFYSARSESPFVRSHAFSGLSGFFSSLRVCTFLYGDSDGVTESAARRECAFS